MPEAERVAELVNPKPLDTQQTPAWQPLASAETRTL